MKKKEEKSEFYGAWKKTSKAGTSYYSGKCELEGVEYWISIFKNEKKNDKQPDLSFTIRKAEEKKQEKGDEI